MVYIHPIVAIVPVMMLYNILPSTYLTPPNLDLKYVFEIVRHGARAPIGYDPGFTGAGPAQLTPNGMRQRYLLGKYNQMKYGSEFVGDMSKLDVLSTETYRTLQSGYAELAGMDPKNNTMKLKPELFKTMPSTFTIRRAHNISLSLLYRAAPKGFINIPIHSHKDTTWDDDMTKGSCPYVSNTITYRK